MTDDYSHNNFNYNEENLRLRKYIFLLFSKFYLFIIGLLIALSAAWLINRYAEPVFSVSSTIILHDPGNQSGVKNVLNELRNERVSQQGPAVQSEIAILKSFELTKRTIENLDFDVSYTAYGRIREKKMYNNADIRVNIDTSHQQEKNHPIFINILSNKKYRLQIDENLNIDTVLHFGDQFKISYFSFNIELRDKDISYNKYCFEIKDKTQLINYYKDKLQVETVDDERSILILTITGPVAQQQVCYLNALTNEYKKYQLEQKNLISKNTLQFIGQQLKIIKDTLKLLEEEILYYRVSNDIFKAEPEGNEVFDKLQELNSKKTLLEFKIEYFQYLLLNFENHDKPQNLVLPSMMGIEEPSLTGLFNWLIELFSEKEEISYTAKTENPSVELINKKIHNLNQQIKGNLKTNINIHKASLLEINKKIKEKEQEIQNIPISQKILQNIQKKYDITNKLYTFLLEKQAQIGMQMASNVADNRVLDMARMENAKQLSPKKKSNFTIAILFGILVPALIIILSEYFNNKISEKEDIENNTNVPLLGTIVHNALTSDIPVYNYPQAPLAESFRRIRANLQYFLPREEQNIIMLSSSISGEGKTFVSINLATILAMSGNKVLLMDLDLRKPRLHRIFNNENKEGMSNWLIGQSKIENIIYKTNIDNLFFTPSGIIPPNPAELLESRKMNAFFEEVKSKFDYVIIDTPPVGIVADTLFISRHSHANIFLLRQKITHIDAIKFINSYYEEKKINNMSIIINDIKESKFLGYNYDYGYGYTQGYGYSYGQGDYLKISQKTFLEKLIYKFWKN